MMYLIEKEIIIEYLYDIFKYVSGPRCVYTCIAQCSSCAFIQNVDSLIF